MWATRGVRGEGPHPCTRLPEHEREREVQTRRLGGRPSCGNAPPPLPTAKGGGTSPSPSPRLLPQVASIEGDKQAFLPVHGVAPSHPEGAAPVPLGACEAVDDGPFVLALAVPLVFKELRQAKRNRTPWWPSRDLNRVFRAQVPLLALHLGPSEPHGKLPLDCRALPLRTPPTPGAAVRGAAEASSESAFSIMSTFPIEQALPH